MSFGGYPIAPGGAGTPGTDGKDAFAATYAAFTWGNANEDLFFQVPAGSVDWMAPLQWISVSDGAHAGYLTVIEVGAVDPEAPEYQLVHAMDNGTAGNPTVGTVIASGAIVAVAGKPGATGAAGATGATGPSTISVVVPATLTTSSGTVTCAASAGPLIADMVLGANAIRMHFGAPYTASDSTNWKWTPGYITPGSPGSFTAIGSGRQTNLAGGAVVKWSTETYTHSGVTIPAGTIPAVQAAPTNFPTSSDSTYGDHVFWFGTV